MAGNYSPGPWVVEAVFEKEFYDICLGYQPPNAGSPNPIASVYDDEDDKPRRGFFIDAATARANARLISTAPELMDVMETLLGETLNNWKSASYHQKCAYYKAKEVFSRARGASNNWGLPDAD